MRRFVLLLAVLCLCGPALAQGVAVTPDFSREPRAEDVDVVTLIGERYPETLALLETEFPADHYALMQTLAEIDAVAGTKDALLLAFKQFTELRRKYAERLRFAPTEAHAAMLGHLAAFYDLVFKTEGPEVCGRFAQDGTGVLFELGLSEIYARAIDQQSVAYFRAVVMAIETPEASEPVQPDDWARVFERMLGAGAPPSFAATIGGGNPRDPDLCPALTAMLFTSSLMDTPEGARTRADFARNVTGY